MICRTRRADHPVAAIAQMLQWNVSTIKSVLLRACIRQENNIPLKQTDRCRKLSLSERNKRALVPATRPDRWEALAAITADSGANISKLTAHKCLTATRVQRGGCAAPGMARDP